MDLGRFSAIFSEGDNFCSFWLFSCTAYPWEQTVCSERNEFAPQEQIFAFKNRPLLTREVTRCLTELPHLLMYLLSLNPEEECLGTWFIKYLKIIRTIPLILFWFGNINIQQRLKWVFIKLSLIGYSNFILHSNQLSILPTYNKGPNKCMP